MKQFFNAIVMLSLCYVRGTRFRAPVMTTCKLPEQTHREVSHLIDRHAARASEQQAQISAIRVISTARLRSVAKQPGMEKSQGR
jgi:hypothetical protein